MVQHALESRSIRCMIKDGIVKMLGEDSITGVRTQSGEYLPCDVLIATVGVEANLDLAQHAGITTRRAALVNDYMQTNDPDVYAIGEVTEHENRVYGTTLAAQQQARIAAAHIADKLIESYKGTVLLNILKVRDIQVASIGITSKQAPDWEEAIALDESMGYYKRCFIHQGRLKGAILIGTLAEVPQFKQWIEDELELNRERMELITSSNSSSSRLKEIWCAPV